uniref:Putative secreted protein n=1 Tax=Anopheles triannulatus TaxID=58253 RepID=A0A2M4B4I1_9DIPT
MTFAAFLLARAVTQPCSLGAVACGGGGAASTLASHLASRLHQTAAAQVTEGHDGCVLRDSWTLCFTLTDAHGTRVEEGWRGGKRTGALGGTHGGDNGQAAGGSTVLRRGE